MFSSRIITEKQSNQINTKKRAHDFQIVRAKKKFFLNVLFIAAKNDNPVENCNIISRSKLYANVNIFDAMIR